VIEPEAYIADLAALQRVVMQLARVTRGLVRAIEADTPVSKKTACEEALTAINSATQMIARFGKHIEAEKRMLELDEEDVEVLRERMGAAESEDEGE
jgi:hypothetical protein